MDRDSREKSNVRKALAAAAILASCLAAAIPLYAEGSAAAREADAVREAGSAAGMDSWRAAWSPEDLDLRDARNRPISRAAIQRELAAGSARMRREAAGLSRLPALKALLDYLERARLEQAALGGPRSGRGGGGHALAVEGRRAPKAAASAPGMSARVPDAVSHFVLSPLQLSTTPGRVRVLVLLR